MDPGHGGKDPGASGNGLTEKNVVLELGIQVKKFLDTFYEGHNTMLTRSTDVFVELTDRAYKANNLKADCFVSLHCNSSKLPVSGGIETYVFDKTTNANTIKLQKLVHDNIMKYASGFQDRGKKSANFSVLRNTRMPAILNEYGFLSSLTDANLLKRDDIILALAKGTGIGIAEFLGLQKKQAVTTKTVYKVAKVFDSRAESETYLSSLEKDGHKGFTIYTDKA